MKEFISIHSTHLITMEIKKMRGTNYPSDEEINLLINKSSDKSQSDSEVVMQTRDHSIITFA